jgi:hypothetical protein
MSSRRNVRLRREYLYRKQVYGAGFVRAAACLRPASPRAAPLPRLTLTTLSVCDKAAAHPERELCEQLETNGLVVHEKKNNPKPNS